MAKSMWNPSPQDSTISLTTTQQTSALQKFLLSITFGSSWMNLSCSYMGWKIPPPSSGSTTGWSCCQLDMWKNTK